MTSRDFTRYKVNTWNARGLRGERKPQELVEYMKKNGVDVCALQETWLEGSMVLTIGRTGHVFVLENLEGCKRRGVGVVLSRSATDAWDAAGRKKWVSECKRLLAVRLVFVDDQNKRVSMVVMSGYRPLVVDKVAQEEFDESVTRMFDSFANEDVVIFGADINGSVGVEYGDTVGKFGICRVNQSGRAFRETMLALGCVSATSCKDPGPWDKPLKEVKHRWREKARRRGKSCRLAASTVGRKVKRAMIARERSLLRCAGSFKALEKFWERMRANRFASWTHPGPEQSQHQLDHCWVKRADMRRVEKAKVLPECLGSDHRMVMLEIRVACRLVKVSTSQEVPRERVNRDLLRKEETRSKFLALVKKLVVENDARSCKEIDEIMNVAKDETLMEAGRNRTGWWVMCEEQLSEACEARDVAYLCFKSSGASRDSPQAKALKRARARVQIEVRRAKQVWLEERLLRIEGHGDGGAPINPADAWKAMDEIERGLGELNAPTTVPLRDREGELATTPQQNLEILRDHFFGVFNRTSTYDRSVIDTVKQRDTIEEIGRTPSFAEIRSIFNCAKSNKAAGLSGSFIELYKTALLDDEVCGRVRDAIATVWKTGDIPEHWKEGKLKEIGKGGGKDLSNPGNYRGIMLLDVVSKAMSALINRRLQELLRVHGRESQNGFTDGRGCRDSSFALRLALQTLREHGCTSHVAFIDLVKAFDSVDRTAMCDVLLRYGAPESLVRVIRAMHEEVIVVLKAGGAEERFESKLGVIQGAAASPTLFLFMISAWLESADWKGEPIELKSASKPGDKQPRASADKKGKFVSHLLSEQRKAGGGVKVEVRDFLYADDAALVFGSRESMEAGLTSLIASGKRWGLQVHAATSPEGKSKTEYMVVLPPEGHANRPASFDESPVKVGENLYITLAVSRVGGQEVKNCFKYLGSFIDSELSDDLDVENRISGASKAFGRFRKTIFRNKRLDIKARIKAFRAFVLSILFYQSECWALKETQRKRICRFYNRCMRSIAGINRIQQRWKRISTCAMAKMIGLAPCQAELDRRCLAWAGHVARMEPHRLVRQMLFAWHEGNRKEGRPLQTIRHRLDTILKDLSASTQIRGGDLAIADCGFAQLHRRGWVSCANDGRGTAHHGTLWRKLIEEHVRCLSDTDTAEKRIGSRRVGKQTPPPTPLGRDASGRSLRLATLRQEQP